MRANASGRGFIACKHSVSGTSTHMRYLVTSRIEDVVMVSEIGELFAKFT